MTGKKILDQDEINALLNSATQIERRATGAPEAVAEPRAQVYNFRRPDRVSKEQIRSLHFLHDRFARNVSTSVSAYLRIVTEVSVTSVEQFTYVEFLMMLPELTAFYAVSMSPLEVVGALELDPNVAFTMIDRMLGGSGQTGPTNRALTEIEQHVIDSVIALILENLTEAWQPIVSDVKFRITGRDTRPQMLQVAAPSEAVIVLVFDIKIGDARGMLNLCLPAGVIESVGSSFTQGWQRTRRAPTASDRRRLLGNLGRVPMPITAGLDASIAARDLVALRPDDVISLGRAVSEPVDVKINARPKFLGRLTRNQYNATLAIESRIHSMAGSMAGEAAREETGQ